MKRGIDSPGRRMVGRASVEVMKMARSMHLCGTHAAQITTTFLSLETSQFLSIFLPTLYIVIIVWPLRRTAQCVVFTGCLPLFPERVVSSSVLFPASSTASVDKPRTVRQGSRPYSCATTATQSLFPRGIHVGGQGITDTMSRSCRRIQI